MTLALFIFILYGIPADPNVVKVLTFTDVNQCNMVANAWRNVGSNVTTCAPMRLTIGLNGDIVVPPQPH